MATIISAILGVVVYLDDIVVHRETSASHDKRLCWVLDAFSSHNLTLNGEKCIFATSDIEFVGFRLISDGQSPLHPNVDVVLHLPEPPTLRRFHNFSGLQPIIYTSCPTIQRPLHCCASSSIGIHPGLGPLHALLLFVSSSPSSPPHLY